MFKKQLKCIVLVLICILIDFAVSLYEDQVGKFDWKLSYIGKAKFAHIEAKRVIVATEENVIAALHLKTGQILWRQIMEDPKKESIVHLHVDKEVITISGTWDSWYIRGWDINSGIVLFEYVLSVEHNTRVQWFINGDILYQAIPVVGSHVEITSYILQTGTVSSAKTRITAPWVELSRCVQAQKYFACISSDDSSGNLYYIDITSNSDSISNHPLSSLIGFADSRVEIAEFHHPKPALLLITHGVAHGVILENNSPQIIPQALSPNSIGVFNGDETLLVQLEINPDNPEKLLRIVTQKTDDFSKRNDVEIQYPLGLGAPYTIAANCKGVTCDLLLSSSDNALTLIRIPEGKVYWTREEALSHVVAAELLELPVSELDASIEREFKASGDVLSMLYQRLLSQAKQLQTLFFGGQLLSERGGLVRDEFGLHKLIVVATSVGKLFGIDTFTGSIVWSYRLPHVVPFSLLNKKSMLLFVQRTARYSPLLAQCILLAKDDKTGNGVLFRFDPISGHSETGIERLNYKIKQAILLPYEDKDYIKAVVVLSEDNHVYIYPHSATQILHDHAKTTYLFSVVAEQLHGYGFSDSTPLEPKLKLNWNLNFGSSKLVALSVRPTHERVHSQGRVLPDRSVYYKYVNPNIIALATLTDDPVHKQVLSVHLVDGVTGLVLYSANHKRVKGPIHLQHSENWVVYSYFNERFRRTEIATVELYEGRIQSNSTVFSSYAVSQLPVAESQAYILPAVPLTMTTTLTERGITSKFILLALSNGIVAEIPWAFIQPRLPDVACLPEESCIPYIPEIPLPPEASINYNQTLHRVRGIEVAPARLESTSHVLVHGLDLFYTRVAPSKTFDVLKEDFDHRLIVLVLSGLIIASYVTKKLASRKALRQAWK